MDLTERIKKIETDINFISCIKDFLMSPPANFAKAKGAVNIKDFQVPVRDQSSKLKKGKRDEDIDADGAGDVQDRTIEVETLQKEVENNKMLRKDVEESAKILMVRLQKVEDELEREKEIKRNLLEGTLQLKNRVHGYHTQILELETLNKSLKDENEGLVLQLKNADEKRLHQVSEEQQKIHGLEKEKEKLFKTLEELQKELESLNSNCISLNSELNRSRKLHLAEEELRGQLQKFLQDHDTANKANEKLEMQFHDACKRIEFLNEKLNAKDQSLKTLKEETVLELKRKDALIQKLRTSLKQDREKLSKKVEAATDLVSRTKSFIVSLQNEKLEKEKIAQKYFLEIQQFQKEKEMLHQKLQTLTRESVCHNNFRDRYWALSQENSDRSKKFEVERERLERLLEDEVNKNRDLLKTHGTLKDELSLLKKLCEREKAQGQEETTKLRTELQKVSDNLHILQKISEDQGKTILKQRDELDKLSEIRYNLEVQLRESHETEQSLSIRLCEEEKSNRELEHQLSLLREDIRGHSCDDFVESKARSKLRELERKMIEMEQEVQAKNEGRHKALEAARKAVQQATQMKTICDQRLQKVKASTSQEVLTIQEGYRKKEMEYSKKIQDLELELGRSRQALGQMQNSSMNKIHQLQTALNACVNSAPQQGSASLGMGSFSQPLSNGPAGFGAATFPYNFANIGINSGGAPF